MPENHLQSWIKNNLKPLPAIPHYANQAQKIVSEGHFDQLPLSQIIAADPGLSAQLFNLINAKRKKSEREYIESVQSALSLMGDASIVDFVNNITTLNDLKINIECEHNYLQLIARSQQAAKHAKAWGEKRHSQGIKEIGIATRLYDIAEFALCLFDHENFKTFKQQNLNNYQADTNCQNVFGFNINQLSLTLCDQFHLPELVKEAHSQSDITGIRTQGIKIASGLMHEVDIGWYHREQVDDYLIAAADLCQMPLEAINTLAHVVSVESAHELEFEVKFHSAANLVQHKAVSRPEIIKKKVAPSIKIEPDKKQISDVKKTSAVAVATTNSLLAELKATAQNIKTSPATQLNALLTGCHKHLNMKRNALFLLNKDKSVLSTRLHSGLENDSPLLKFSINKIQAGLLKLLLEKPQAIWINPDNFRKYDKMLPGIFKSCCLSDDFFMMSLFNGKTPLGIVFCDNYGTAQALKKPAFDLFKQAVGLTSKAMLLINQRQQQTPVKK